MTVNVPKFLQPHPIEVENIGKGYCNCNNYQFDETEKSDDYPCLGCIDKCEDQDDKNICPRYNGRLKTQKIKMADVMRMVEAAVEAVNNNSLRKELGWTDAD